MRLVRVSAPAGKGKDVARLAFDCGIKSVSIHQGEEHRANSKPTDKDVVDVHVATPEARSFIASVVAAPFFDPNEYSVDVREPRAVLKASSAREITRPLPAPLLDVDQELWQFVQVTPSFVLRVLIAGCLLAYGMVHDNPLFMVGGLLFLPFMPLLLGIAFGVLDRQWSLVGQSLLAAATATLLITAAGATVASMTDPPMLFDKFPPVIAGVVFSLMVAVAGALATVDDAGHRQLVGLAAASQVALIPAWFGLSLVFGFPDAPAEKLLSFGLNLIAMIVGGAAVYAILRWRESKSAAASAKYQNRPSAMRHA